MPTISMRGWAASFSIWATSSLLADGLRGAKSSLRASAGPGDPWRRRGVGVADVLPLGPAGVAMTQWTALTECVTAKQRRKGPRTARDERARAQQGQAGRTSKIARSANKFESGGFARDASRLYPTRDRPLWLWRPSERPFHNRPCDRPLYGHGSMGESASPLSGEITKR